MSLGRTVQRAEQCPALDSSGAAGRIHVHPVHPGEVDHESALGDGVADDAVSAALDADLQVVLPGMADRGHDVPGVRACHDDAGVPVDHGVPDRAGGVVPGVAGPDDLARDLVVQSACDHVLLPSGRPAHCRTTARSDHRGTR
jgi:hypothetical protein